MMLLNYCNKLKNEFESFYPWELFYYARYGLTAPKANTAVNHNNMVKATRLEF